LRIPFMNHFLFGFLCKKKIIKIKTTTKRKIKEKETEKTV